MKSIHLVAAIAVSLTFAAVAVAAPTGAWLDVENCTMCKSMTAEPGLMEHMTWESHTIDTGMVSITTVDAAYAEAYARSHAAMDKVIAKLQAGEELPLCGHCQSMGALHQAGAKIDKIDAEAGHLMAVTSTNPEVIAKIHAHTTRTQEEFAKWMEAEKAKDAHAGHDH